MFPCSKSSSICIAFTILLAAPTPQATATEEIDSPFASTSLFAAQVKNNVSFELANKFFQLIGHDLFSKVPEAAKTYSNNEIETILNEYDRIVTAATGTIEHELRTHQDIVNSAYSVEFKRLHSESNTELVNWARINRDFIVEALPFSNLAMVLSVLSPEIIPSFLTSSREYSRVFGSLGGADQYQIHVILNTEKAAPILPQRFDVQRLRNQEREIFEVGKKLSPFNFPDGEIFRTSLSLTEWIVPRIRFQLDSALIDLNKLAIKTRCITNEIRTKLCN